jgi:radical SAM protein with 4Fe4S-binding SPASM domain
LKSNPTFKEFVNDPAMCTLPWHGFCLSPNGDVKNCVISNEKLGNIQDTPIADILHNQVNRQIKQDMQEGTRHKRCVNCYRSEDLQPAANNFNKISNRTWYMKVMGNHDLGVYSDLEYYQPQILDVRWRNTCNLACVYCGPDLSSKWALELKNLNYTMNETAFTQTKDWILTNLNNVHHVYLAGGEPLLIKENLELLKELYKVNPDAQLRINTNLTNINNEIFDMAMNKFKNTHWTVSLDSTGDSFEYIRYGSKWDQFVKNLTYLQEHADRFNFNMVWCILNAYSIFDAFDFLVDMGFSERGFIVQPLFSPEWLRVNHLHNNELDKLRTMVEDRLAKSKYVEYSNSLISMLTYINAPFEKNISSTLESLNNLNTRRNLDFSNSLQYLY